MNLYVDLDETLIGPVRDWREPSVMTGFKLRPGVREFLQELSKHGRITILTAASFDWAREVVPQLPGMTLVRQVVTREELYPIAEQMAVIEEAPVTEEEREALYREVEPIYPTGYMFDDYPVGSWMWRYKSLAAGIPPKRWIQVSRFTPETPDREGLSGLKEAIREFRRRLKAGASMGR